MNFQSFCLHLLSSGLQGHTTQAQQDFVFHPKIYGTLLMRITSFRPPEDSSVRVYLQNLRMSLACPLSGEALEPLSVLETNYSEASVVMDLPTCPGTALGGSEAQALSACIVGYIPSMLFCPTAFIGLLSSSLAQHFFLLPSFFALLPQPLVLMYISMRHHNQPSWYPFV